MLVWTFVISYLCIIMNFNKEQNIIVFMRVFIFAVFFAVFVSDSVAQQKKSESRFHSAYNEIVSMLEDRQPLSIKRSVFLAEWAFLDGRLDYEKNFVNLWQRG